jgi:hypothetical protein
MLTPEEAKKRLDALCDKDWRARAGKRIGNLRRHLREPAAAFAAPQPPRGVRDNKAEEHRKRQLAAARALDGLPESDRAAVMAALHPGLGAALTRWWADEQSRPYTRGWNRKAFRASDPSLTITGRASDLASLVDFAGPYDADPVWLAIWGGHLSAQQRHLAMPARTLGGLLASAIGLGGHIADETFGALAEIGNGEHPVGIMGRHVIVALLGSPRPEGWECTERLLLAAQRQEGLRQSILESADEGHPEAFDRILHVMIEQKLLRFAASVRAAGVWLGFGSSVAEIPFVEDRMRKLAAFRASETERELALAGADQWDAYTALCAGGMRDVLATLPAARKLAGSASPDLRAAALRYLAATGLGAGQETIAAAVDDADVRVASLAVSLLTGNGLSRPATFAALTRLIERSPAKPGTATGLGVEQAPVMISQAHAAGRLVQALGDRSAADLVPWLPVMDVHGRASVANLITGNGRWLPEAVRERGLTAEFRPVVIGLLSDRSSLVRGIAIAALSKTSLAPSEAPAIEALLTRAATDLRRGALTLLASLPPKQARACAARLSASADKRQQEAAAELSREIGDAAGDAAGPAAAPIEDLHAVFAAKRVPASAPRHPAGRRQASGGEADQVLLAIGEIADRQRDVPVTISWWQGTREMLFGDVRQFPSPFGHPWQARRGLPGTEQQAAASGMVLGEVFREWWAQRPSNLRGEDEGLDALRAYALATVPEPARPVSQPAGLADGIAAALAGRFGGGDGNDWWYRTLHKLAGDLPDELRQRAAVRHVTTWLAAEHANSAAIDECLNALEATLAAVPPHVLTQGPPPADPRVIHVRAPGRLPNHDWRNRLRSHPWGSLLAGLLQTRPGLFGPWQIERWYRLMRWAEQPVPDAEPLPVADGLLAAAHGAGAASDADVAAAFLHPRNQLFKDLTRHWRGNLEARYPALAAIADDVRDRVVAVELLRGDLPTATSHAATNIASVSGVESAAELLRTLGKTPLTRGWRWAPDSRGDVLSHLLRVSFPAPGETGADLKAAVSKAGVPETRLVDLALYAPQWAALAEEALGWPGLTETVLWLHAHTKNRQWSVDQEIRDSWAAQAAERTSLSAEDLVEGAVDVDWFRRGYAALGPERWAVVHKAARYASGGAGHRRAQLFAEAMLGMQNEPVLSARITGKRYQDAVHALGLLPLPADPAAARQAVRRRYQILREFERGSKKFGSMRQASERRAVRIGVENLARTAGYADPLRFSWAMEAAEAGDLADEPVVVEKDGVALTLSVNAEGTPDLAVRRGSRVLKSVPAVLRKNPDAKALQERKAALVQQAARVRQSLEAAMTAQDIFTPDDFAELRRHPVVAPMLAQLVWVTEDGVTCSLERAVSLASPVRIAHPADMTADGTWVAWQERLFSRGRRQPFKQVFREFYRLTDEESKHGPFSGRYDGHQVQPRQALALFGARGWVTSYENGGAARVFHRHGLAARVSFANGMFSPMEADLPAVDGVGFTRRGEFVLQPLGSVPPVVFSEAMRDLDLVVSVAHAGGVDPEATASTTEMRAALIRETARLLKLANIEFAGDRHVVIKGTLGEYSLHLGSGIVHRRPGGAVCIIPVGSQHRGRVFLPFADDDPKTAEIVSKTLLLARDHEIKDPTILEQLRS